MSKLPKLTARQLAYALARIAGKKQADAMRTASPQNRLSAVALHVEAYKLENHPKVQAYMAAARKDQRNEVLLTRDKKRLILGEIASNAHEKAPSRIAAIHQDNLMTGDHKPVRVEGEITLHAIFSALAPSTGLPSPDEVRQLKPAVPTAAPKTREHEAPATTAMERAG